MNVGALFPISTSGSVEINNSFKTTMHLMSQTFHKKNTSSVEMENYISEISCERSLNASSMHQKVVYPSQNKVEHSGKPKSNYGINDDRLVILKDLL